MTILEENRNDNSSIVDLEIRVSELENVNVDQDERITANTENLEGEFCCDFLDL